MFTHIPYNAKFCTVCGHLVAEQTHNKISNEDNIAERGNVSDDLEQIKYLEKLAELRDKGIITNEEFEKRKKDILEL